jgi:hypothetical protein
MKNMWHHTYITAVALIAMLGFFADSSSVMLDIFVTKSPCKAVHDYDLLDQRMAVILLPGGAKRGSDGRSFSWTATAWRTSTVWYATKLLEPVKVLAVNLSIGSFIDDLKLKMPVVTIKLPLMHSDVINFS